MKFLAGLGLLAGLAAVEAAPAEPLSLAVNRIDSFGIGGGSMPDGPLLFLGGLHVSSDHPGFGGISGIDVGSDGTTAYMMSDSGSFVSARLVQEGGRLAGLADAEIHSLFPAGDMSKRTGDWEDIAFDPADSSRGVLVRERQANAMLDFSMQGGRPTALEPRTVGADDRILRSNKGLESVAYAPSTAPLAGGIVAIAERAPRGAENIPAWIAGIGAFHIVPRDSFEVSSARFLPGGDLLLLERRYVLWGISMRLRRIAGSAIAVGAVVDGDILLEAGMTYQIDNMEGLAVHEDAAGRTILTLVSDDNNSILQRTLILQFALAED